MTVKSDVKKPVVKKPAAKVVAKPAVKPAAKKPVKPAVKPAVKTAPAKLGGKAAGTARGPFDGTGHAGGFEQMRAKDPAPDLTNVEKMTGHRSPINRSAGETEVRQTAVKMTAWDLANPVLVDFDIEGLGRLELLDEAVIRGRGFTAACFPTHAIKLKSDYRPVYKTFYFRLTRDDKNLVHNDLELDEVAFMKEVTRLAADAVDAAGFSEFLTHYSLDERASKPEVNYEDIRQPKKEFDYQSLGRMLRMCLPGRLSSVAAIGAVASTLEYSIGSFPDEPILNVKGVTPKAEMFRFELVPVVKPKTVSDVKVTFQSGAAMVLIGEFLFTVDAHDGAEQTPGCATLHVTLGSLTYRLGGNVTTPAGALYVNLTEDGFAKVANRIVDQLRAVEMYQLLPGVWYSSKTVESIDLSFKVTK